MKINLPETLIWLLYTRKRLYMSYRFDEKYVTNISMFHFSSSSSGIQNSIRDIITK